MSSDFLSVLQFYYNFHNNINESETKLCVEKISDYKFYQYSLIPAILMCALFAATKTRRQILLSKLGGRPGLVYPMDTLTRSHSFSYACAFGITGFVVYRILYEQKFAIEYTGPISLATLIAILSMFIYGIVFFPVFASLALESAISYGLGAVYVWMFFIIDVFKLTECEADAKGRLVLVIRDVPNLLCLAYLSVSLPVRCVLCIRKKIYFTYPIDDTQYETMEEIRGSYQGIHVRELLRKPVRKQPPVGKWNIVKHYMKSITHRLIYHRKRGFQFPARLVSVMFVAGCTIYVMTVEFLFNFVSLFNLMLNAYEAHQQKQQGIINVLVYGGISPLVYKAIYIVKVSTIVSISVASLISLLTILNIMTSFRNNLFALYRGDFRKIPPPSESSAINLCVGSVKFAGYQVAYIFWAYIVTVVVLFIVTIILAALISLLASGTTDWLVYRILQIWPGVLIGLVLYLTQLGAAKWFFLQDPGEHLRLNNRRFYFIFTYFMFFFNIFMGIMSCLIRIIEAIAIGIVVLARLDNSTLPRSFEFLDPGFSAYCGFIHMEAAHTHPVVSVFIRLLTTMSVGRKENTDSARVQISTNENLNRLRTSRNYGDDKRVDVSARFQNDDTISVTKRGVKDIARFNWHVTYTLLNNPMIRIYRKGYIQALRKARSEGIHIPVSDKMFTEFDLVKSSEQKEKERLEELDKIKSLKTISQLKNATNFAAMVDGQNETVAMGDIGVSEQVKEGVYQMQTFV